MSLSRHLLILKITALYNASSGLDNEEMVGKFTCKFLTNLINLFVSTVDNGSHTFSANTA